MLTAIIAIIAGFVALAWGADRLVDGAAALARKLGVSSLLIGLTIVGFGTSAPEVLVAVMASAQGNPQLALGNAVGSNIANIGLILGVTALVVPLAVHSKTLKREYPLMLAVTVAAFLMVLDHSLDRIDGLILLGGLVLTLIYFVRIGSQEETGDPLTAEFEAEMAPEMSSGMAFLWFILGLLVLLVGSRALVWGAVEIAQTFGVSDLVIGLTIVAVGTSLPELAAGVASALKNEPDLAIGNVIGSNLYNLLAVMSMPALIAPGAVAPEVLTRDMPVMLGLTLLMLAMAYSRRGPARITRGEGVLLLLCFVGFQSWVFLDATS